MSTELSSTKQVRVEYALRHVHGLKFKLTLQNVSRNFLPDQDLTVPRLSPTSMTCVERSVCDFRVAVPVRVEKDGRRSYKCSSCELHKTARASILGHINRQKGDILQCGHCQYNTWNPDSFKQHQNRCGVSHAEYFSCKQCDFKTCRPSHLIRHRLAHSKPKHLSCPFCSTTFSLKWNLHRHKRQFHSN